MKFEIEKKSKLVELKIHENGQPVRLKSTVLNGRTFVRGKAPTKKELLETIDEHSDLNFDEFYAQYYNSMSSKIDSEMKALIQNYMRIKNAIDCIDLIEEIRLNQSSDYEE